MRPTTDSLARRERRALSDTALLLGSDAPTLCEGWTARDLVVHLLVRERHPLGALGTFVPRLGALTDRAAERVGRAEFPVLVQRVREPGPVPFALPPLEALTGTAEMFVHHEDLRRAQPDWAPRALGRADEDALWGQVRTAGRMLARTAGVGVRVVRADADASATLVGGDGVVVTGRPSELLLALFGRDQVDGIVLEGPDEAVAAFRAAGLGG